MFESAQKLQKKGAQVQGTDDSDTIARLNERMLKEKNEELGTVNGLGKPVQRETLHQDPFQNLIVARDHKLVIAEMNKKLLNSVKER